jgi:hypothetical protein
LNAGFAPRQIWVTTEGTLLALGCVQNTLDVATGRFQLRLYARSIISARESTQAVDYLSRFFGTVAAFYFAVTPEAANAIGLVGPAAAGIVAKPRLGRDRSGDLRGRRFI